MPVTLRPLDSGNLSACKHLQISAEQRLEGLIEETPEMIEFMCEDPECVRLTIYNEDTMVGFIAYSLKEGTGGYQIERFIIDQAHQRQGYGENALRQVLEQISNLVGCDRVVINYMALNEGAAFLYEKIGFVVTDEFQSPEEFENEFGARYAVLLISEASKATEKLRRKLVIDHFEAELERLKEKLDRV